MAAPESARPPACIACGQRQLHAYVRTMHFTLHRCAACRSLTALPRPPGAALTRHHDSHTYFHHPYFERRRTDVVSAEMRSAIVLARVRAAVPGFASEGARHLDVGCDTGILLETLSRHHGTVGVGVDIAARSVALGRARGLDVRHGTLEEVDDLGDFDIITLIDVIEHVAEPVGLLSAVRARLRPLGVCYVETPNVGSIVYGMGRTIARLTGGRPASICERLFLPEHVQYFSASGLACVANEAGLTVRHIGRRTLGAADVNTAPPVRAAVHALQGADRVLGREILHCAVLTR